MIPLITVEGPTASGKTAFAMALARAMDTEIISADSRQIYKHMDIGTAKPTAAERQTVPHHLIGFLDPHHSFNAGSFAAMADTLIQDIASRGKIPIVCGGTGMYIRALLEGLCQLPPIDPAIRQALRERLQIEGSQALHAQLSRSDPDLALRISPNDPQRVMRGLEVYLATGKPLSVHWQEQARDGRYHSIRLLIDPPRELLYKRIDARARQMIDLGLAEEVRSLLDMGYRWTDPGMNTLGYKEFHDLYGGGADLDSVAASIAQHSRNYAKRQCTWYRKCRFDLTFEAPELNISLMLDAVQAIIH